MVFRGKCSFKDISNLYDGVKFLEKNQQKNDFVKAVKEMSFVLQQKIRDKSILSCGTLQIYTKYMQQ